MKLPIFVAILSLSGGTGALAQPVTLANEVRVEKQVMVDGRPQTVLIEPRTVVPGDRLVFNTRYGNADSKPVANVVILNPVPKGVVWSGDSSPGVQVSVDGGRSFGTLDRLRVATPTGPRAARADDVTHLRWSLAAIQPGASGVLRYRGSVR